MPDNELLKLTLKHIEAADAAKWQAVAEEDDFIGTRWQQASWRCETGQCFAGWAAELAGARWAVSWTGDPVRVYDVVTPDGREVLVSEYARERLGLDEVQADSLFDGRNSLLGVQRIVAELTASPQETP